MREKAVLLWVIHWLDIRLMSFFFSLSHRHRQHFVALHTGYLHSSLLDGKSVTMFSFEGDFKRTPNVSLGGASRKVRFPYDMMGEL